MRNILERVKTIAKNNSKPLFIIAIPLIASILPLIAQNKESKCAFVLVIMSMYWTTECIPIAITSLIPIFLFPVFGIASSKTICKVYFQDIIVLFYGGLVMANAIEMSGLHERISLKVLLLFGSNPKWLMLGFMIVTAFMSMWISNAASCSMMLPMISAVVKQLIQSDKSFNNPKRLELVASVESFTIDCSSTTNLTKPEESKDAEVVEEIEKEVKSSEKGRNLATCFLLSCSYSSTIGGLGSLVGTAPNILFKGFIDENYPAYNLTFLKFSLFATPVSVILILLSWLWLTFKWLPKEYSFSFSKRQQPAINEETDKHMRAALNEKYERLGPTTFEQKCVATIFASLVVLWITRDVQGVFGWGLLFNKKFITDTTPAILAVFCLFACPKKNIFKGEPYTHLIGWKQLQEIFPWNVILLIGGGLALANGFEESGLSDMIGEYLKNLMSTRKEITLLIVIVISALSTEFTSNTSIASIFLPIVNSIAVELNMSPIYLLMPLILSVSLAFALPVATPNNAIIFANGFVRMKDMIATGIVMNIFGLATVYLAANTWLRLIFDLTLTPVSMSLVIANSTRAN